MTHPRMHHIVTHMPMSLQDPLRSETHRARVVGLGLLRRLLDIGRRHEELVEPFLVELPGLGAVRAKERHELAVDGVFGVGEPGGRRRRRRRRREFNQRVSRTRCRRGLWCR